MPEPLPPPKPHKQTFSNALTIFGIGKEKDFFIENLSLMISSGMPISAALKASQKSSKSKALLNILKELENEINSGSYLWQAFGRTGLFDDYSLSLIRIGEESGRLSENLKLLSLQQEKNRVLKQRIHAAMVYPAIVFSLTLILGLAISWFILPRLAGVFTNLNITIPFLTRCLIATGNFLMHWGAVFVPSLIALASATFYLLFVSKKTKHWGQGLLFHMPGIKKLIMEVELSRFGTILGGLLAAGVPIVEAMKLLAQASEFSNYRRLLTFLKERLEEGNSFEQSFGRYKGVDNLIPISVQQIVSAGERSGKLEHTFSNIGKNYEEKSSITAQSLSVIIEPLLLIVVWSGVAVVALGVIVPLYSLIGGLNSGTQTPPPPVTSSKPVPKNVATYPNQTASSTPATTPSVKGASTTVPFLTAIRIKPNLPFLYVHRGPSLDTPKISNLSPKTDYQVIGQNGDWLEVIGTNNLKGWILSGYVEIQ